MNTEDYEKALAECWDAYIAKHGLEYAIPEEAFVFAFDRAYNLGMEAAKKEEQTETQKKTKENADTFASDNKHFDSTDVRFKKID